MQINRCIPLNKHSQRPELCLTCVLKVVYPLTFNRGRITIADAEGNCCFAFFFCFLSEIMTPPESKTTNALQNVAGNLSAQIELCNMKRFPWVRARMCHEAGINQSFLIHKSFSSEI